MGSGSRRGKKIQRSLVAIALVLFILAMVLLTVVSIPLAWLANHQRRSLYHVEDCGQVSNESEQFIVEVEWEPFVRLNKAVPVQVRLWLGGKDQYTPSGDEHRRLKCEIGSTASYEITGEITSAWVDFEEGGDEFKGGPMGEYRERQATEGRWLKWEWSMTPRKVGTRMPHIGLKIKSESSDVSTPIFTTLMEVEVLNERGLPYEWEAVLNWSRWVTVAGGVLSALLGEVPKRLLQKLSGSE